MQADDREEVLTNPGQFLAVRGEGDLLHIGAKRFEDRQGRQDTGGGSDAHQHTVDNGQGQWNPQDNFAALPGGTGDVNLSFDLFQIAFNNVHPDTTA